MLKLATSTQSVKFNIKNTNTNRNPNRPSPIIVTKSPKNYQQKNKQEELNRVIGPSAAATASPKTDLEVINQTYSEIIKSIEELKHNDT